MKWRELETEQRKPLEYKIMQAVSVIQQAAMTKGENKMDSRLAIAQRAVVYAEEQLGEWLRVIEKCPGLESFRPQKEQILRMNLEAAKELVDRFSEVSA